MTPLELEYKPDAAQACARMEAWWNGAILDRPTIQITAPGPPRLPWPQKSHPTVRDRWLDVDYIVACGEAHCANTFWGGEILPQFWPNLGPEILTAALGAEMEFGPETSWSVPMLHDWAGIPTLAVDPENPYIRVVLEMTRRALEIGAGKFLVGITDLHPGADLAASLRDPQQLCVDVIEAPERVRELMDQLRPTFYRLFELQHDLMHAAGQTITTSWLPLFTEGRYYIPSCDFCCMISPRMFRDLFLSEIEEEIAWLDRSIFHLDGPGAVRHLDALLEIDRLGAIQYVCGTAQEPACQWMEIFQRIQNAGKNIHVSVTPDQIPAFMEALRPEGVMLCTWARSPEEADALIQQVSRWRGPGKA